MAQGTPAQPRAIHFAKAIPCQEIPRLPVDVKKPAFISTVEDLISDFDDGERWGPLQGELRNILASCQYTAPDREALRTRPVIVFLVTKTENRAVVLPASEPYSNVLLGYADINVVLLVNSDDEPASPPDDFSIMSTKSDNLLAASVAGFVKQIIGQVAGAVPKQHLQFFRDAGRAVPDMTMAAYAATVHLPFTRASLEATGTVTLKGNAKSVAVAAKFSNVPKTRVEFTAVGAAIVTPQWGALKMKIDAKAYASDPLSRSLTMVAVAFHKEFDGTASAMSSRERVSMILGCVLTPATGIGAGISVGLIRGLGITGGGAAMWVPSAPHNQDVGATAPTGDNQLGLRPAYGLFFGANYVFKP